MKIRLTISGKTKIRSISSGTTIAQIIKKQGLNNETLIIKLNGRVSHESTELKDGDKLELVGIIYGG